MKCSFTNRENGIIVRIDGVSGQEEAILETLRQCRKSAWACPSGECLNIGAMEERVEDGSVVLTLTPRSGARLSLSGIEECVGYMLSQAVKVSGR